MLFAETVLRIDADGGDTFVDTRKFGMTARRRNSGSGISSVLTNTQDDHHHD